MLWLLAVLAGGPAPVDVESGSDPGAVATVESAPTSDEATPDVAPADAGPAEVTPAEAEAPLVTPADAEAGAAEATPAEPSPTSADSTPAEATAEAVAVNGEENTARRDTAAPSEADDRRRRGGLGELGMGGIATLAQGALIAGVGVGLHARPDTPVPSNASKLLSTKSAGVGLMVGGGAAVGLGAILLVVDAVQRKRANASREAGVRLGGGVDARGGRVMVTGRF